MLTIPCPICGCELRAQEQYAGRPVQCPQCQTISRLPPWEPTLVVCAECGEAIDPERIPLQDTQGRFYHPLCHEEACRRASTAVVAAEAAIRIPDPVIQSALEREAKAPRLQRPRSGLGWATAALIALGLAVPAFLVTWIVFTTVLPLRALHAPPPVPRRAQAVPFTPPASPPSLSEARRGFRTRLQQPNDSPEPASEPPADLFRLVYYEASVGQLAAYLTVPPGDDQRHPAILWINGGDCNTIGDCWSAAPVSNDQSARAFRQAGIVMLFPSLRGGNNNPGAREGFFGEVEDVLAAADYLARQPYVDPQRIYLGGHSTGGTLALLVAECSPRFRAVFSFGPVHDVTVYPRQYFPWGHAEERELELRKPIAWLAGIQSPLFVFEGEVDGNLASLQLLAQASRNPLAHFYPVAKGNHFSILAPTTRLIATKILNDEGTTSNLVFSSEELNSLLGK